MVTPCHLWGSFLNDCYLPSILLTRISNSFITVTLINTVKVGEFRLTGNAVVVPEVQNDQLLFLQQHRKLMAVSVYIRDGEIAHL
jgi:hypothetical protein